MTYFSPLPVRGPQDLRAEIISKTTWILLAVAINAMEYGIPRIPFFPWLKPGLANCVTILWIVEFGVIDALLFSLLRIWIVGFYFGFSFLTLSLGLCGAVCSTVVMGAAWTMLGKRQITGSIGIGIIGALTHNFTQILIVYFLLAKNTHLFYQVPIMLAASIVFGTITGWVAPTLLQFLHKNRHDISTVSLPCAGTATGIKKQDAVMTIALLSASLAVVFIDTAIGLGMCALVATALTQVLCKGSLKTLLRPFTMFWLLFVFIACVHLFFSYGTVIEPLPFLTVEGVRLTGLQWLRLWTWLELSFILTYFNFHEVVFYALRKLFPKHQPTLFAGVLALEFFPTIVGAIRIKAKSRLWRLLRHPISGMRKGMEHLYGEVVGLMVAKDAE